MKSEAVRALVAGLKEAGIQFVVSLPSSSFIPLIDAIANDPHFTHVPVSHEANGIGICAGAWLGGKKPALVMQNLGLVLSTYALMGALRLGGFPTLLVIDHRGDMGDKQGHWFFDFGRATPQILEVLEVPYRIVGGNFIAEIVRAQQTTEACGKPVAVLLSGEEIYGKSI